MATYCPEDEDRELFSCPICFEDYDLLDTRRAPKLLLCLHTFCYECTQKLWKNDGSLECSMCRMQHERVCLEDLFDNPVIIQHLEREQEEKDFEFARKIDQEMRNEFGGSPVIVAENNSILEEHSERDGFSSSIEILDLADESIETGEVDLMVPEENSPRVSNMDNDQEEDEEEELEVELEANERGINVPSEDESKSESEFESLDDESDSVCGLDSDSESESESGTSSSDSGSSYLSTVSKQREERGSDKPLHAHYSTKPLLHIGALVFFVITTEIDTVLVFGLDDLSHYLAFVF